MENIEYQLFTAEATRIGSFLSVTQAYHSRLGLRIWGSMSGNPLMILHQGRSYCRGSSLVRAQDPFIALFFLVFAS